MMIKKIDSLGIVSSHISTQINNTYSEFNHETRSLLSAAGNYFQSVVLIDPAAISIELEEGTPVEIYYRDTDISMLSALMVRGTRGIEIPTKVLVHSLSVCGCHIIDPITRFSGERASKMLTTIRRHTDHVGSSSYMAFNRESTHRILERAAKRNQFPLLLKSVYGKQGNDITIISDLDMGKTWLEGFYSEKNNDNIPMLLQKFEHFTNEYRLLLIHGYCIGSVEKKKKQGQLVGNRRFGSRFVPIEDKELETFTLENVSDQGVLGVDVGRTIDGELVIIEANRAPEWSVFEKATGLNVAEVIMERIHWHITREQT